jgi:hypothetical protein
MNTMDNTKIIETIEKITVKHYLEKLIHSKFQRLTLHSVFPLTAAPNYSDSHEYVMIQDLSKIMGLNSGQFQN